MSAALIYNGPSVLANLIAIMDEVIPPCSDDFLIIPSDLSFLLGCFLFFFCITEYNAYFTHENTPTLILSSLCEILVFGCPQYQSCSVLQKSHGNIWTVREHCHRNNVRLSNCTPCRHSNKVPLL